MKKGIHYQLKIIRQAQSAAQRYSETVFLKLAILRDVNFKFQNSLACFKVAELEKHCFKVSRVHDKKKWDPPSEPIELLLEYYSNQ